MGESFEHQLKDCFGREPLGQGHKLASLDQVVIDCVVKHAQQKIDLLGNQLAELSQIFCQLVLAQHALHQHQSRLQTCTVLVRQRQLRVTLVLALEPGFLQFAMECQAVEMFGLVVKKDGDCFLFIIDQ